MAEACHNLPSDHTKLLGPVRVEIVFYLHRPPSVKMSKRAFPIVPPDLDKLIRSSLDGISQGLDGKVGNGLLWGDDALAIEIIATKLYADDREPGADITITEL